jgi:hypothetical protein
MKRPGDRKLSLETSIDEVKVFESEKILLGFLGEDDGAADISVPI